MAGFKSKLWRNTKPPAGSAVNWGDPISRGLIGHWLFNEGGGNIAKDIARLNNGTLTGGVSRSVGKFGKTLSFDGTDDYVAIPAQAGAASLNDYTVSAWVYLNAHNTTAAAGIYRSYVFDSRGDGSTTQNSFAMWLDKDSPSAGNYALGFINFYNTTPEYTENYVAMNDSTGKWVHLCVNRTGTTLNMFVNGIQGTTVYKANVALRSTAMSMANSKRIGTYSSATPTGAYWLNGKIENIRIYNRALNPNEIKRLYTEPFAGIVEPRFRLRSSPAATSGSNRKRSLLLLGVGTK